MTKEISLDDLKLRLESATPPILVEALPAKYYDDWHLPGARHLPHDEVRQRAASTVPDRSASIVVYCASDTCRNSHIAASQLAQLGYGDVSVFAGGKKGWSEAGLPIETGVSRAA
jgi:rhodanese-related sulfurtransferase